MLLEIINNWKENLNLYNYSPETIRCYYSRILIFLNYLKEKNIENLNFNYDQAINFINYLKEKNISNKSINQTIYALTNFYEFLKKKNIVEDNIFKKCDKLICEKKSYRKYLTDEEFNKIYENVENDEIKLALLLARGFGLRLEEVLNIKKTDIFEKDNFLIAKIKGKGKKIRETICLNQELAKKIKEKLSNISENGNLIKKTKPMMWKIAYEISKKINIKFTWHKLRHAYGVEGINKNIRIEELAYLMGHSNLNTTMIYTKITTDKILERLKNEIYN